MDAGRFLSAGVLLAGVLLQGCVGPPVYSFDPYPAEVGGRLKRNHIHSDIALNRRLSELPAADRERFLAGYPDLEPGQLPPFPKLGLKDLYQRVANVQSRVQATGPLAVLVHVDATGAVESVDFLQVPTWSFRASLETQLRDVQFDPGTCNGKPCAGTFAFSTELEPTVGKHLRKSPWRMKTVIVVPVIP